MTELTISMVAPALPYFPVWVADRKGMFEARGISARTEVTGTTDRVTASLKSGASRLAMVTPEGVIVDAAAGGPLRLVAGNTNRAPLSLIAQPGIRRIEDLRDGMVGTSSLKEGTAILVQRMLAAHGLHYPGDYDFALVGAHPQRWAHLQDGTIDAGLQLTPYDFIAEAAGYSMLGAAADYVPHYAFTAVAVDSGWAQEHADLVGLSLAALQEATVWTVEHLDEAAELITEVTGGANADTRRGLGAMFDAGAVPLDLAIDPRALDSVFSSVREAQLVPAGTALDWAMCVDDTFLQLV